MPKTIDPRLTPDLLYVLAAMGHGDVVAVVDANFPAESTAATAYRRQVLRLDNLSLGQAVETILTLMPVDTLGDDVACRMAMDEDRELVPAVQAEAQVALDAAEGRAVPLKGIARDDFYACAKQAFAVVQTGERRFYGCVLLKKGVIAPRVHSR